MLAANEAQNYRAATTPRTRARAPPTAAWPAAALETEAGAPVVVVRTEVLFPATVGDEDGGTVEVTVEVELADDTPDELSVVEITVAVVVATVVVDTVELPETWVAE
jgi:hypothetical protein